MLEAGYVSARQLAVRVAAHRHALGDQARVAFVLQPGAAAGAYQAGALQALGEHGVQPDLLVGASIGAFNGLGALLDALAPLSPRGPWPDSRLGRLWRRLSHRQQGSGLIFDKPCLVGWLTGRPDWNRDLWGAASHLVHLGEEVPALQSGVFSAERLKRFTAGTVLGALGDTGDAPEQAGRRLVEAWNVAHATRRHPPTLVVAATALESHEAVPFVLGDPAVAERLFARRWPVRMLGHHALVGAAVIDVFAASGAIPAVFPPQALPADRPDDPSHLYIDGAIGGSEPFHLAIDAGATMIVSLEVESFSGGMPGERNLTPHFAIAAAESFMIVQERFQSLDARGLARWNRRLETTPVAHRQTVPLYRLAPQRRELGILDFDGRYRNGTLEVSLFDGYMRGYAEAGGSQEQAWIDYHRGLKTHRDTGVALVPHAHLGFWNGTYVPAPVSPRHPLPRISEGPTVNPGTSVVSTDAFPHAAQ